MGVLYDLAFIQKANKSIVDDSFEDFRVAGKKRCRAIVRGVFTVTFFKYGSNFSYCAVSRKNSIGEADVHKGLKVSICDWICHLFTT